eukprot:6426563-Prorocentrum_lima.AAC.1
MACCLRPHRLRFLRSVPVRVNQCKVQREREKRETKCRKEERLQPQYEAVSGAHVLSPGVAHPILPCFPSHSFPQPARFGLPYA